MIGIIDYGGGNLGSVVNACRFLGLEGQLLTEPDQVEACQALVLPGQGMFGDCMQRLRAAGFEAPVHTWVEAGRPFLGICVGLQILFDGSDESPDVPGLGVLPGRIRRFDLDASFKVPQMGWNAVQQLRPECPLFEGVDDGAYFYFVHSYYADPSEASVTAGTTHYGGDYTSVVWKDNVVAAQFHPEKSQAAGLALFRNFARWAGVKETSI